MVFGAIVGLPGFSSGAQAAELPVTRAKIARNSKIPGKEEDENLGIFG